MLRRLLAFALGRRRSPHWPAFRRSWLKNHGSCDGCGTTEKLEVHHVVPFEENPARELDLSNVITLCESRRRRCHFILGHKRNWRTWNPNVRQDAAANYARLNPPS